MIEMMMGSGAEKDRYMAVAVGLATGLPSLYIVDMDDFSYQGFFDGNPYLRALSFSPDGEFLAVGLHNGVSILNTSDWSTSASIHIGANHNVQGMSFSPSGEYLACAIGSSDSIPVAMVYETTDWTLVKSMPNGRSYFGHSPVFLNDNETLLYSVNSTGSLGRFWAQSIFSDTRTQLFDRRGQAFVDRDSGQVAIGFNPAIGSDPNTLRVYEGDDLGSFQDVLVHSESQNFIGFNSIGGDLYFYTSRSGQIALTSGVVSMSDYSLSVGMSPGVAFDVVGTGKGGVTAFGSILGPESIYPTNQIVIVEDIRNPSGQPVTIELPVLGSNTRDIMAIAFGG